MAVICSDEDIIYVSHQKLINEWLCLHEIINIQYKSTLFDIFAPFLSIQSDGSCQRKRKRVQKTELDLYLTDKLDQLKKMLAERNTSFSDSMESSNSKSQEFASKAGPTAFFFQHVLADAKKSGNECTIRNPEGTWKSICLNQKRFWIPPKTTAYLTDLKFGIGELIKNGEHFDAVVLDPPWINKSVKRSKKYQTSSDDVLILETLQGVEKLFTDNTLVVVWCTPNEKHESFIRDRLFPKWNICPIAKWYWLKVTVKGEPVYPLGSPHKKPYEYIIIGRYQSNKEGKPDNKCIPERRVVVSVPSAVHSHKPPLSEIIAPLVAEGSRCLELFARCLIPGWTSVGNEVLKLQHEDFFHNPSSST